ncbi:MAG: outer membrane protein assembly factor BamD [Calditrichaeota bacterium]|nr:MAG: outer membrane protein assembly factor BamD [Calditrichota bacterium]
MKLMRHFIFSLLLFTALVSTIQAQQDENSDFSYALKLYNEGFYDVAAQQFSTFINRYPGSEQLPDAHYFYGQSLLKLNDLENARIEFQELAVTFPEHERAPEAWKLVGYCYEKQKKLEQAAKAYETVKVLYPDDPLAPGAFLTAAEVYMKLGQLFRAESIIKEFLDRYPTSTEYPHGRILFGKFLLEKGEPESAAAEFAQVLTMDISPEVKAEAYLGQAEVFLRLGLTNRARENLNRIITDIQVDKATHEALLRLIDLELRDHHPDKALSLIENYGKKFQQFSQKAQLTLRQVIAYFLKQDYPKAESIARDLKGQQLENAVLLKTQFYLACALFEQGKTREAIDAFRTLDKLTVNEKVSDFRAVTFMNLIRLYTDQKNFTLARQYLNKFQQEFPNRPEGETLHRAIIRTALGHHAFSIAVEELQRYLGLYPDSPYRDDLLYHTGVAFFRAKQIAKATGYFQQIHDNYVCSAKWDSSRFYLSFIRNYYESRNQSGVTQLAQLIGQLLLGKDRSQLLYQLGKIYFSDLKDYQQAASIFEQYVNSISDSSQKAEGMYYLSECYTRLIDYKRYWGELDEEITTKARETLKSAITFKKYLPHADSITYRFLTFSVDKENTPPDRYLKFWRLFEQNYPSSSLLPEVQLKIAETALTAGDTSLALEYLDKIIMLPPKVGITGQAYWDKAEVLAKSGQYPQAIEVLKSFLLNIPSDPLQARAYWQVAEWNEKIGNYSLAAQFRERLLDLFNYSDFALNAPLKIIDDYIQDQQYEKALQYVEKQLSSYHPSNDWVAEKYLQAPPPEYYFYAGKAYFQHQHFSEARTSLLSFLDNAMEGKLRNEALFMLGAIAEKEQDFESALLHYSLVNPESEKEYYTRAMLQSANIYFSLQKFAESKEIYEKLISFAETDDNKIFLKSRILLCLIYQGNNKEYQTQLKSFQKLYKKHPQLKQYLALLEFENGKYRYQKKQFDPAIAHFNRVLKKYKKSEYGDDARYYLARCYATMNQNEKALKEIETFIKDYPESELLGNVYLTRGEIYLRGEKTDEGIAAIQKAIAVAKTADTRKSAMGLLINAYRNLGLWDGALQKAREFVKEFPDAPEVDNYRISIGIFLIRLNRYSEAIEYLRKLKFEVSGEQKPEIQFYIGEAYFNAGQYEQAINEFLKIPLLSQKTKLQWEASAFYYAGQSYERLGRRKDAIRMYQEIINRPGIQIEFKREARKLIDKLSQSN